ncbi:hypothetical protein T8K17_16525 [Thalassobaculum sp. OXR-137]|uniref:hypothetical protein n=1 Tax=Thalassobaculum sp. OXR-137 TaxID=3100173 RepID=UPI002AC9285D|nr:hypothetical protein [Thalassobaculum sp. OXR-137]WPZ32840.1 hypothetical protein T8K17_16525 [Thalassobaculum sp. OXR-137]
MQGRSAALFLAASLAAGVFHPGSAARAEPLGDRIAEALCYPPSAETLDLTAGDRKRLLSAPPLEGAYRDIQGSEARAWFEVLPDGSARCRTPANSTMTVYFCAAVSLDETGLRRARRRLCKSP